MKLAIDPETLLIAGDVTQRVFTAAGFAALEPPGCPVCGLPATVQRIGVTMNAEDEALHGRSYIIGLWDCPRGCDPRTGWRQHFEQTLEVGSGGDGHFRLTCSCGADLPGLTAEEFAAARREHSAEGGQQ